MTITRSARNRALKLSALGAYAAIAAIAACSSDPSAPTNHIPTAGASAGGASAGAPAAGAPAAGAPAAGAPGAGADAGGAPGAGADTGGAPGAGTGGDQTAGAPAGGAAPQPAYVTVSFSVDDILWVSDAGTGGAGGAGGGAGAGAGGTGGSTAGAGGTAGAAGAAAGPYCSTAGANVGALPYVTTKSFIGSDYQPNGGGLQIGSAGCTAHYDPSCGTANDNKGVCGLCTTWTYTPNPTAATYAGVGYVRKFDGNFTAPQICFPANATAVTFYAKGAVGGEKVTFTAQGGSEVPVTLTNAWAKYSVPIVGAYNTDTGVEQGFYWKVVPYVN